MFSIDFGGGGGEGGINRHWNGTIHGWTNEDTLDLRNIFVQNEARGNHSFDTAADEGRRNLLLPRLSSLSSTNDNDNGDEDDSISAIRREGRYHAYTHLPSTHRGISRSNEPQKEGTRRNTGNSINNNNNTVLLFNHKDHTDEKRRRLLILGDPENTCSGTAAMHQWITRGAHAGSSGGPRRVWAGLYGGECAVLGGIGEDEQRARDEAVRVAMSEWPLSPRELAAIERRKARQQEEDVSESGASSPTRSLQLSPRGFFYPRAVRGMDGHETTGRPYCVHSLSQLSAPDGGGGYHRTVIGGSVYGAAVVPSHCGSGPHAWDASKCRGGGSGGAEALPRKLVGNAREEKECEHNPDDPYEIEEAFLKSIAPRPPSLSTFEGQQHQLRVLEAIAELTCSPLNPCNNAWASSATNPLLSSGASSLAKAFVPPSLMPLLAVEAVEERADRVKRSRVESANDRRSCHPFGSTSSQSYSAPARLSDAFYQMERLTNKGGTSTNSNVYSGGGGLAAACVAMAEEERLRKALLTDSAPTTKVRGHSHSSFQVSHSAMFSTSSVGKSSSASGGFQGFQGDRYLLPNGLTPSQRFALLRLPAAEDDLFAGKRDVSIHDHGGAHLIGRASIQRNERQGRVLANYKAAAVSYGGGSGGLAGESKGSASVNAVGRRSVAAVTDLAASTSASMLGDSLGRSYGSTIRSQKDRAVLGGGGGGACFSSFSSPTSPSSPSPIDGSPSDATGGFRQSSDGISNGVISGTPMQSLMALVTMGVDPERVVALLER